MNICQTDIDKLYMSKKDFNNFKEYIMEKNDNVLFDYYAPFFKYDKIFNSEMITYSPYYGLSNYNFLMFTEFTKDNAIIFFNLIENLKLEYGIFAGSSIGYLRDKRNMYWTDDYDILVFKDKLKYDLAELSVWDKNGFICAKPDGGYFILSKNYHDTYKEFKNNYFQCDVFLSYIDDNNIVYNTAEWGLYHGKLNKNIVLPFKKIKLNNIELYGFNNIDEEVKICYGDISKGHLYTHASNNSIKVSKWELLDQFFEIMIAKGIANVNKNIFNNKNHFYEKKINILDDTFNNTLDVLKFIKNNNVKILNIFNSNFLKKFIYDIKFYFSKIIINFYCYDKLCSPLYLNKCSNVYFYNQELLNHYNSEDIIYISKPNFDIIRLITFGTFDLFHDGHDNIFKQCEKYSNHIIVGLSSDEFTFRKKNIYPFDNFNIRKEKIKNNCKSIKLVFSEEKMELKNEYISNTNANLFLMGDDWAGKFDDINCNSIIYTRRTDYVCSTDLRNEINQYYKTFDFKNYINNYPELKLDNKNNAWKHWVNVGINENKTFFNLQIHKDYESFNWLEYKQKFPKKNLVYKHKAYDHFLNAKQDFINKHNSFIYENYINNYDDIKTTTKNVDDALKHWEKFGINEERTYINLSEYSYYNMFNWKLYKELYPIKNLTNKHDAFIDFVVNFVINNKEYDNFNWEKYKNKYEDLKNLNKNNLWVHWILYGKKENRSIN